MVGKNAIPSIITAMDVKTIILVLLFIIKSKETKGTIIQQIRGADNM
jgi:hypothetical protein